MPRAAKGLVGADVEIVMPLGDLIDVPTEAARIGKDIGKCEKDIAGIEKKLGEPGTSSRAARPRRSSRRTADAARRRAELRRKLLLEAKHDAAEGRGRDALARSRTRAGLFVVDLQERLVPAMPDEIVADVLRNSAVLIAAAAKLGLPIVVSQQYPKGLGATVDSIEAALRDAAAAGARVHRFDKVEFSAASAPGFVELVPALPQNQWIVCGMETHVCVYQTVRDLAHRGDEVHVVSDAVCSRAEANWKIGLELCARAGAVVTSTEVVVFELLERAGSEDFKALSKAIR